MTILKADNSGDMPEVYCPECDMRYTVIWNRNPAYTSIEFCPFCGDEVEGIEEFSEAAGDE